MHLLAECVPLAGEHRSQPAGEVERGAGEVGMDHRGDWQVRQLAAVVVGDLRVVPVRDLAGEDPHHGAAGQPQVGHRMAAHGQVIEECDAARRCGDVGETLGHVLGAEPGQLVHAGAERLIGGGEVVLVRDVVRAPRGRSVRVVVDHQASGPDIRRPLVDCNARETRPGSRDRREGAGAGRPRGGQRQGQAQRD
jgi:hypothetical protein